MSLFKKNFFVSPTSSVRVNIPGRNLAQLPIGGKWIWAIGGGKGGIGKTLLTSNIAVYLTWLNKKVVVVDMDLGGANTHTILGVDPPPTTLSDLLLEKVQNVEEVLHPTPIKNLHLISGAHDPMDIASLRYIPKSRLERKLRSIEADFILLDLGAGTAQHTLDFFLIADRKIVVVTPDPTSVENAYRFIKSAFFRMLRGSTSSPYVRQLIEQAIAAKSTRQLSSPKELLAEVNRQSALEGAELEKKMLEFSLSLIVNQVRVRSEEAIGKSIQLVCERYFGMKVDYSGFMPYDSSVWQSVRRRVPFLIDHPHATVVTHLEGILRNLLSKPPNQTP